MKRTSTSSSENNGEKRSKTDEVGTVPSNFVDADEFETEVQTEVKSGTEKLELKHALRHQVALPPNYDYTPISEHVSPAEPARVYPFTLDPFQQTAIHAIERNESVLVSAHTSAGKTVVAEYAIAQSLKNKTRVVYTSPIKALSNQKYREMSADFGDVGLMTGDVTINPTASCLVMTTEILRSMLYRGSEVMREVAWVIFDEIHYMRDKERGVVWEETLILLPHKVRYVFLSATIPNAMQFAEWICTIHSQPCHVVYTDYRPTPLQHYLFPSGSDGIHLVVDEKGQFREDNFQKAMGTLQTQYGEDSASINSGQGRKGKTRKGGNKSGAKDDIRKIVKMIMVKNYNPVIVFAFSKRECEALALQMSKMNFNTDDERDKIDLVFTNAIQLLSEEDRSLPQIKDILPLLKRGVGIHHGGLLPLLKEIIEILFQEGLLKVLFATETFSIGLNMPAKTVVFTSVQKFDGQEFRTLSGGEYIQMSGRAGRRGLDDRGIVIMMTDEKIEPAAAKAMVKGQADRLDSAFHLGYNMILNLMRVEGLTPEYLLERSFYQFQNTAKVPELERKLAELETEEKSTVIDDERDIEDYYNMQQQLTQLKKDIHSVLTHPTYLVPFLSPGRLVHISYEGADLGWGVVVGHSKRTNERSLPAPESIEPQERFIVDVLVCVDTSKKDLFVSPYKNPTAYKAPQNVRAPEPKSEYGRGREMVVIPVFLWAVQETSRVRIPMPKDIRSFEAREKLYRSVKEVQRRLSAGLPLLEPVQDMKIEDDKFKGLLKKVDRIEAAIRASALERNPRKDELYAEYSAKRKLQSDILKTKKKIEFTHNVLQLEELKSRKRVLRRLGFCTSDDVVEQKGRVACEISTGDELLLTELVFNGVFNDLTPEQCAALLSCFVFDEKSKASGKLKEDLAGPLRIMQEGARRIAKVSIESKMNITEEDYVQSFKPELMDVVFAWCNGATFTEVTKMTDVFEGSIIRVFRRLQELIQQMAAAAKAIGSEDLEKKFTDAHNVLERPTSIVFAASLYL